MLIKLKCFQFVPKFAVRQYRELTLTQFPDGHLVHTEPAEYLTNSGNIEDKPNFYTSYIKDKIESRKRENDLKKARTMEFLANTRYLLPGCHKDTVKKLRNDLVNFPEPTADIWDYIKEENNQHQIGQQILESRKTTEYKILNKLLKISDFPIDFSFYSHQIRRNNLGFGENPNNVRSLKSYCYYLKGVPQLKKKRYV